MPRTKLRPAYSTLKIAPMLQDKNLKKMPILYMRKTTTDNLPWVSVKRTIRHLRGPVKSRSHTRMASTADTADMANVLTRMVMSCRTTITHLIWGMDNVATMMMIIINRIRPVITALPLVVEMAFR